MFRSPHRTGPHRTGPHRTGARRALAAVAVSSALLLVAATAFALRPGQPAPEIGLQDLNGNQVTLASLRGKVVLVDFWATWCAPCEDEMPVLQRLYDRYRERGFTVVAISQDRTDSNVRRFVQEHGLTFPVLHDTSHAVAGRYRPQRMPSSYIIDRNGVVRHVHAGYRSGDEERFEREIQALLAQR